VHLGPDAEPARDPGLVLRVAAGAAHAGARIDRETLDRLAATPAFPDPWPAGARDDLVSLLGAGPPAIAVWETLDRRDLVSRVLPEWAPVRSRPQRNAYHRFTVDRHLCEAAAEAASLTRLVARPDLLLVGAWIHDIGKGYAGDHTEVGMELVARIGRRMGFVPDDVDVLLALVEHHLLLPDVATRRDLDDDATIEAVATAVGSPLVLELLAALTEADSIATGPSAWSRWKAGLVSQLVARTAHVLEGGRSSEVTADADALPDDVEAMAARRQHGVVVDGVEVTVVTEDRPGVFARAAGALALAGLDVLAASATSRGSTAISWFRVEPTLGGEVDGDRVRRDVERAVAGRLSIDARLADRARTYRQSRSRAAAPPEARVIVDNEASETATVLEVRAADALGVLYFVTKALADLDLDIRSAKVQTLGHEVVDTFYVTDAGGKKITDAEHLAEIEAAVLHAAG
jgi:[protein-PII] uridylyltransferase